MATISELKLDISNTYSQCALDVSEIMKSLDNYSKGDEIQSKEFQMHDFSVYFSFYPKGLSEANDECCSIAVVCPLISNKDNENREMYVSFEFGDRRCQVMLKIGENEAESGMGYINFCKIEYISKHPLIRINIKIENDPLSVVCPTDVPSVKDQNQKLYNLNKIYDDVTLIVKKANNKDAHASGDPARKKRKLNMNANNNNNQLKVNGLLLRSASSVFHNMLTNNMKEKEQKTITIYSESVHDVDNMIYFMITNELRKNSNALNIIRLAHLYEMKRLFYECINRLLKELNVNNFVDTVNTFVRYEINTGYQQLIDFGKINIDKLKEKDQFVRLPHSFRCGPLGTATKR